MALCVFFRFVAEGLESGFTQFASGGNMSGTGVSGMEDIGIKMKKKKKRLHY